MAVDFVGGGLAATGAVAVTGLPAGSGLPAPRAVATGRDFTGTTGVALADLPAEGELSHPLDRAVIAR